MALGGLNQLREEGRRVHEGLTRATAKAERYLDVDWTADMINGKPAPKVGVPDGLTGRAAFNAAAFADIGDRLRPSSAPKAQPKELPALDFMVEPVRGVEVSVASHEDVWKLWDQSVQAVDHASNQRLNARSLQLTAGSTLTI